MLIHSSCCTQHILGRNIMASYGYKGLCNFEKLFSKSVPHLLEKIFFNLDYESFKTCMEVNSLWCNLLKSESYLKRARDIFQKEISHDGLKLHSASRDGRMDDVRRLLSTGMLYADCLPAACNYQTPLFGAASHGHDEIVKYLIQMGADPNKANKYGQLPMSAAAEEGHENVVRVFLDHGMDPDKADGYGLTALQRAAAEGHTNVVRMLLQAGAEVDKTDYITRDTALHCAAESGFDDVFKLLVDNGADPNKVNKDGHTPIDLARLNEYHLPSAH